MIFRCLKSTKILYRTEFRHSKHAPKKSQNADWQINYSTTLTSISFSFFYIFLLNFSFNK